MSAPAFAPERGEIWYSDGRSGFYAVRVTNGVWPFPAAAPVVPEPVAPEAPADPAASRGTGGSLPATGGSMPQLFLAVAALAAVLLVRSARRARP